MGSILDRHMPDVSQFHVLNHKEAYQTTAHPVGLYLLISLMSVLICREVSKNENYYILLGDQLHQTVTVQT